MPFKSYSYDDSITRTGGGVVRVPAGDYIGRVSRVEASPEDAPGEWPYHRFHITLVDGRDGGRGKTLRYHGTTKPDAHFGTGNLLLAAGIDPSNLRGMGARSYAEHAALAKSLEANLRDKPIGVEVADDTYDGKDTSQITGFFSPDEWALRRPMTAAAPASVTSASAGPAPSPADDGDFRSRVDSLFKPRQ